jgi:GT2 family glycosyltransferase
VNWNTRDLLAGCLQSVYATIDGLVLEVIVVDNASTDGSPQMVRNQFPRAKLIESQENLGFARGNAVALREASGEYLLLLNPDAVLQPQAVARLCAALDACPDLGAVGAQLLNPDGTEQESWGRFPSLWTELPILNRLQAKYSPSPSCASELPGGALPVDWLSGACLLIRRKTLEEVGLLDEDYWLYTEEADWCFRARQAGWEMALLPQAQVVHIRRAASRQRLVETMMHFYRSRLMFLLKHRGRFQASAVKLVLCAKTLLWLAAPSRSPLSTAYPDLSSAEMRRAYRQLARLMLLPLGRALEVSTG